MKLLNNELYHYGVPGMKWGVRRNPSELSAVKEATRKKRKADILEKGGQARNIANSTAELTRSTSSIIDSALRIRNAKRNAKSPARKMSDQELQKAINRMNMERTYNSLVNERRTSRGATYAKEALGILGSAAALTGAALGIATSIKTLRS